MNEIKQLLAAAVEGMKEKKARDLATADLGAIETAPCRYFALCTGGSPQQVEAIVDAVAETIRKTTGEKPATVCGLDNAEWVAMDYGTVVVHVFLPDQREYYDLEHLWDEAVLTEIPNED